MEEIYGGLKYASCLFGGVALLYVAYKMFESGSIIAAAVFCAVGFGLVTSAQLIGKSIGIDGEDGGRRR